MILTDGAVYTDNRASKNARDIAGFHHVRVDHSKLFAGCDNRIKGIEKFWNQARHRMGKFNGVPHRHFHLFLKECEWRFDEGSPSRIGK